MGRGGQTRWGGSGPGAPPATALARRCFLAGLGLAYAIAFVSLGVQIDGLVGPQGILPAAERLAAIRRGAGGVPWAAVPTVFWLLPPTTGALQGACVAGAAASLAVAAGILPAPLLALSWGLYLSLLHVCGPFLAFQWDTLLLEAGFLGFLHAPPGAVGPHAEAWRSPPHPVSTWLLRLLLFKLMFLSGLVKLASGDPAWRSLRALEYHYETTCLPTWTGWALHQMPGWFHRLSAGAVLAVELLVPFLVFAGRRARATAAAAFCVLMALIAGTGNYGFFNLLTVVLCMPLLDDDHVRWGLKRVWRGTAAPRAGTAPSRGGSRPRPLLWAAAVLVAALSPWPFASALRVRLERPRLLVRVHRLAAPFHIVNGYGLFARMTTRRPEIVVEGTADGRTWRPYEFRWKPGDPHRRPGFVQPHMPRLDWRMWFAALGSVRTAPWFVAFARRLLEASPPVLRLLRHDPFAGRPPLAVRAELYDYRFSTWTELRRTGRWWRRTRLGPYLPAVTLDPAAPGGVRVLR